jgi:hypothetical protein
MYQAARLNLGSFTMATYKTCMKAICSVLAALSTLELCSCSCAIFHEEFKTDRSLDKSDQAKVDRVISGTSFTLGPSLETALGPRVVVFQVQNGQLTFHDVLCPLISPAFYVPGPTKWYENNNGEVNAIIKRLQNDGINFKSMRTPLPPLMNDSHNKPVKAKAINRQIVSESCAPPPQL